MYETTSFNCDFNQQSPTTKNLMFSANSSEANRNFESTYFPPLSVKTDNDSSGSNDRVSTLGEDRDHKETNKLSKRTLKLRRELEELAKKPYSELSKKEIDEYKKQRRMQRNRASARRSREKTKRQFEMLQRQVVWMASEHERIIRLLMQKMPKDAEKASLMCILVRQQKEINRLRRQLRKERGIDINMETIFANDMKFNQTLGIPPQSDPIQVVHPNDNLNCQQSLHIDPMVLNGTDIASPFIPSNVSKFAPFAHGLPVSNTTPEIPSWQSRLSLSTTPTTEEQNHAMMINTNSPFASYANIVNVQNFSNPIIPPQIPSRNKLNMMQGELSVPAFSCNLPFNLPNLPNVSSNDNHSPCF